MSVKNFLSAILFVGVSQALVAEAEEYRLRQGNNPEVAGDKLRVKLDNLEDGDRVLLYPGVYEVDCLSIKNKKNVTLASAMPTPALVYQHAGETCDLLSIENSRNVTVESLSLLGNRRGPSGDEKFRRFVSVNQPVNCCRGVKVLSSEEIRIRNNYISGFYEHGIAVYGDYHGFDLQSSRVYLIDNKITNIGNVLTRRGWGVWIYKNVVDSFVMGNHIDGFIGGGIFFDDEHSSTPPKHTPCERLLIQNNVVTNHNSYSHLVPVGIGGSGCKSIEIISNRVIMRGHNSIGLHFSEGQAGYGLNSLKVQDNYIQAQRHSVQLSGNVSDALFTNNYFFFEPKETKRMQLKLDPSTSQSVKFVENQFNSQK